MSVVLSIPHVSCHSNFSCDFKLSSDYVFADDFWSVGTPFSLAIAFVNNDSFLSIVFICKSWISIRCRFNPSTVIQFSKWISRSTVTELWLTISGSVLAWCFWQFHVWPMNLFLLSISRVGRAVDSTRELSLRFQLWFQALQRLYFRLRFMVSSDADFTNYSNHQQWLFFLYWFHLWIVD